MSILDIDFSNLIKNMPKKTVKMDIPTRETDKLIELAKRVLERNKKLGDKSLLKELNMADFEAKLQQVISKRNEAKELRQKSEALMEESQKLLGTAKGQTKDDKGTVLYYLTKGRDLLKAKLDDMENASTYGYETVVKTASKKKS
jgi:hypothetical protein